MADSALHAVITADIVESTTRIAPERRESFAGALREAYEKLRERLPNALPYPIAVFSGDSWQCYVEDPKTALRVGLYLRAWARFGFDVDTRFVLAIDTVDFVNEHNIAESDGDAFRASGAIRRLREEERLMISTLIVDDEQYHRQPDYNRLMTMEELLGPASKAVARLADRIARSWTVAQAQAVMWRLLDPDITHDEIAERWMPESITQQSISKHLARAGWSDLHKALEYYESVAESSIAFAAWLEVTKPVEPR